MDIVVPALSEPRPDPAVREANSLPPSTDTLMEDEAPLLVAVSVAVPGFTPLIVPLLTLTMPLLLDFQDMLISPVAIGL
ncbi:hypothetical protein D3C74_392640 [compost metagenome]